MRKLLFTCVLLLSYVGLLAQSTVSTTTNTANNAGGGATMFEVSATIPVFVTGAAAIFSAASGVTGAAEVWYKQGSILSNYPGSGNVSVAGGWTLAVSGTATSTGPIGPGYASISFGSATIPLSGSTVYTFVVNGAGTLGGTRYMSGTTGNPNSFTDGTLTINNLNGRGGTIPSSMANSPRYFVGSISYIPQAACTGTPTPGTSIASAVTVCPNQNFTLSLQGATLAGSMAYQWQSATTASGPWTNMTGATSSTVTASHLVDTYYRCEVFCTATSTSAFSTPVQVLTYPNLAAGTYSVGSGGTYSNLTAAFAAASCGVSGPVIFNVLPSSGPYNEQLILGAIPGMSATNTITVNGNGNTVWFKSTNTLERAVIKLNGTNYISFKNLNIRAVGNATTLFGFGVQLMNGANYNTFKNCTIQATDSSTSSNYAGFVCSNSASSATGGGLAASYLTIDSCSILGGYYGLTLGGVAATKFGLPTGNKVRYTTIQNFTYYGVYTSGQSGLLFKGNDINRATRVGAISSMYGIFISGRQIGGVRIEGNKIHDNASSSPSTSQSLYGIYTSSAIGELNNPLVIANNIFYNINHNIGGVYGMYSFSLDSARVLHNNFNFDNANATGATTTYANYYSGTPTDFQVKNNVYTIGLGNTGTKYAQYWATSTAVPNSNNNSFDFTGAGGTSNNVAFLGTAKPTLAAWQASAGTPDLASVMANPLYISASTGNLTPQSGSLNATGANVLSLVPVDINNVSRTITPDMGAYEYSPASCSPPTISVTSVIGTSATIAVSSTNVGGQYTYEWGPCGFQQGTGTTYTLTASGNINLTSLVPNTCYRLYVKSDCGTQSSLWVYVDFTTPCATSLLPYFQDFSAYPVPCWTTSGSNAWMQYMAGSNGVARANFWSWVSGSNTMYTTQPIAISSAATVGFKWAHQFMASYPLDGLIIRAKKTTSATWDTLFNKKGAALSSPGGATTTPGTFITELLYLPASYVGSDAVFELRANSGFGPDLFVDDFEVKAVPVCPDPVLVTTGKTATSVSLSWANVPGTIPYKSKIVWGPQGFMSSTGATGTVVNQINTPYTIASLTPNTYYDFYVQDSCGGGNFSALVGPLTVKTNCVSTLAGTYTINAALPAAGTNFTKLDSAITILSQCGISAATTFNLAAANFTGSINLGPIQGASALRPITFNGAGMNATKVNAGLGTSASVDLVGSKHIRIQNMTLNNSGGVYCIRLQSNADSITIENCKIIADSMGTSNGAAIAATASSTSPTAAGSDVDNLFIRNNTIIGGYYGLALTGTSTTLFSQNYVVENNNFRKQYYYGARFYYVKNINIIGNTFNNFRAPAAYGLYAFYTTNMNLVGNNVMAGGFGMYLYYANYNAATAPAGGNNYIVNNMTKGTSYGAYMYSPRFYQMYHNTFLGNYGCYISSTTTVGSELKYVNVKNNIFAGSTYSIYISPLPTVATNLTLDYNAYQGSATALAYCGSAQATLAAWQTAQPTYNAASVSGPVLFMAANDLHILGSFPNNLGALLGVTTDIDGQVRPAAGATAPDMGADEFTPITDDSKVVAILGAGGGCGSATTSISLVFENLGVNNITSMPASVKVTSPSGSSSVLTANYTGNLAPYSRDTVLIGSVNTYDGGLFSFKGYSSLANDGRANNDTVVKLNVNFIPYEPQVGPADTVCMNQDSVLLAVPGYTGTLIGWYTASTGGSNFTTGNTATVSTNGQLTYYVQYESSSDTVQVGTGTTVSTGTLITPYKTFYMDGRVQYLILASELAAMGASAGNINSLAFEVMTAASQTMGNFTISIGGTSVSAMSASYMSNTGFTTVYTNAAYGATAGWNVHTFTSPYLWNGSDNLVVEVCFDNTSYTSNSTVSYTTTSFNSVTDGYADLTGASGCTPGAITNVSTSANRPNMRFAVTSAACSSIRNPVSFVANTDTASAVGAGVEAPAGTFAFNSTGSNGDSYTWYYGDGFNGSGAATSHTYAGPGSFVVSLVVTDSTCGTIDSIAFTVTSHIGMEENFGQSLRAYPNPSHGQFVVEIVGSEALDGQLELINGLGQVVVSKSISKDSGAVKFPIDVRDMPKGVYTLRLSALEGQRVLRVVLQ